MHLMTPVTRQNTFQSVAGHPLRPARDRRLGEPLPHQQANPIWAHPMARGPRVPLFGLATLCGISYRFQ